MASRRVLVTGSLLWLTACTTGDAGRPVPVSAVETSPESRPAATGPLPPSVFAIPPAGLLPSTAGDAGNPCVEECKRRSQAVAMAWDAIVAQCERSCDHAPRPVRGAADLDHHLHQIATISGRLERTLISPGADATPGFRVLLEDTTEVWLFCETPAINQRLEEHLHREIELSGRLLPEPPGRDGLPQPSLAECRPDIRVVGRKTVNGHAP